VNRSRTKEPKDTIQSLFCVLPLRAEQNFEI
jgi:hypothetical protein